MQDAGYPLVFAMSAAGFRYRRYGSSDARRRAEALRRRSIKADGLTEGDCSCRPFSWPLDSGCRLLHVDMI
jgi:hypothetical protein